MSYFLRRLVFLTDNTARVASEIKLVAQWRSQYTSSCVSFNFPLQKLSRENGYKLWVQWLPGSFAWKSVSYDWSMLFKETISQSKAKLVNRTDPNAPNACTHSPCSLRSEEWSFDTHMTYIFNVLELFSKALDIIMPHAKSVSRM